MSTTIKKYARYINNGAMFEHLKILNIIQLAHNKTHSNFDGLFWPLLMALCSDSNRPIKHCLMLSTLLRAIKYISDLAAQFLCCETGKTKRQHFLICGLFNVFLAWVASLMSSPWAVPLQEYNKDPFLQESTG